MHIDITLRGERFQQIESLSTLKSICTFIGLKFSIYILISLKLTNIITLEIKLNMLYPTDIDDLLLLCY